MICTVLNIVSFTWSHCSSSAWVAESHITDFDDAFEQKVAMSKSKLFIKAVEEACRFKSVGLVPEDTGSLSSSENTSGSLKQPEPNVGRKSYTQQQVSVWFLNYS